MIDQTTNSRYNTNCMTPSYDGVFYGTRCGWRQLLSILFQEVYTMLHIYRKTLPFQTDFRTVLRFGFYFQFHLTFQCIVH